MTRSCYARVARPQATRAAAPLPREERQAGEQSEAEGLVVESVARVCLQTPGEAGPPRNLDAESGAGRKLAVVVVFTRDAGETDERTQVHHRRRSRQLECGGLPEVIEGAHLEVVDEDAVA